MNTNETDNAVGAIFFCLGLVSFVLAAVHEPYVAMLFVSVGMLRYAWKLFQ